MQYYKRARSIEEGTTLGEILEHALCKVKHGVTHRHDHSIPGMVPAQDIWIFAEDPARDPDRLYMTIKNPCKAYRPLY